jgi:uncharacterized protein YdeI (YjbR/CyaY-like superfamily)
MNPKVDWYFHKAGKWQEPLETLRAIVLSCGLTEELKWGVPCYTLEKGNVVLLHYFKEYCAVLFPKGSLLKDAAGLLIQQTEHTQAARQLRFTSTEQVRERQEVVQAYIHEAIAAEKAGLKVEFKKTEELAFPQELQAKLTELPALNAAFAALTPGRQRAYLIYFSGPKQAKTRAARIEKCTQRIFEGKGLNE